LEKNKDRFGAQEYEAYSSQYSYVSKIMKKFDDPAYDDENKTSKMELVEMMQKVFPWRVRLTLDAGIRSTAKGDYVGIGAGHGFGC
jgi:hypothetical protein